MENFNFFLPAKIYFGEGGIEKFLQETGNYGRNVMVVTGKNFARTSGLNDRVSNILSGYGIRHFFYSEIPPEPAAEDCSAGAAAARERKADAILSIGGGSAMDAGKTIAVLAANDGEPSSYYGESDIPNEPLPVIAIPTTCGSGSEVTRYAVLIDKKLKTKKTVSSVKIIPKLAILDPGTLWTLPPRLVAGTGMDALCHAIESYLSLKASHISRVFCRESIKLLTGWLKTASEPGAPQDPKSHVFLGSLYAGFGINHTGTILVHGMAYSLTVKYGMHHGTANALCLPYALKYLKKHGYEKELSELEPFFTPDTLRDLVTTLKLPSTAAGAGVKERDIPGLAADAVKGCERAFKNMKTTLDEQQFSALFRDMYSGNM